MLSTFKTLVIDSLILLKVSATPNKPVISQVPNLTNCGSIPFSIVDFHTFTAPPQSSSFISFYLQNPNAPIFPGIATNLLCNNTFPAGVPPVADQFFYCDNNQATWRYAQTGILETNNEYGCGEDLVIGYAKGEITLLQYELNGGEYAETPTGEVNLPVVSIQGET